MTFAARTVLVAVQDGMAGAGAREAWETAVEHALARITTPDALAWWAHCGDLVN